jgi:hypothetical protein
MGCAAASGDRSQSLLPQIAAASFLILSDIGLFQNRRLRERHRLKRFECCGDCGCSRLGGCQKHQFWLAKKPTFRAPHTILAISALALTKP